MTLALIFFVDVVKHQKASSRFFCERTALADSLFLRDSYHHYLSNIHSRCLNWLNLSQKNSIIVVLLGIRMMYSVVTTRSQKTYIRRPKISVFFEWRKNKWKSEKIFHLLRRVEDFSRRRPYSPSDSLGRPFVQPFQKEAGRRRRLLFLCCAKS